MHNLSWNWSHWQQASDVLKKGAHPNFSSEPDECAQLLYLKKLSKPESGASCLGILAKCGRGENRSLVFHSFRTIIPKRFGACVC